MRRRDAIRQLLGLPCLLGAATGLDVWRKRKREQEWRPLSLLLTCPHCYRYPLEFPVSSREWQRMHRTCPLCGALTEVRLRLGPRANQITLDWVATAFPTTLTKDSPKFEVDWIRLDGTASDQPMWTSGGGSEYTEVEA